MSLHTTCYIAGPLTGQQHPVLMVVGGMCGAELSNVWLLDVDKRVWSEVGMSYLIMYPVKYMCKHADSYSKPVCTHRKTLSR